MLANNSAISFFFPWQTNNSVSFPVLLPSIVEKRLLPKWTKQLKRTIASQILILPQPSSFPYVSLVMEDAESPFCCYHLLVVTSWTPDANIFSIQPFLSFSFFFYFIFLFDSCAFLKRDLLLPNLVSYLSLPALSFDFSLSSSQSLPVSLSFHSSHQVFP